MFFMFRMFPMLCFSIFAQVFLFSLMFPLFFHLSHVCFSHSSEEFGPFLFRAFFFSNRHVFSLMFPMFSTFSNHFPCCFCSHVSCIFSKKGRSCFLICHFFPVLHYIFSMIFSLHVCFLFFFLQAVRKKYMLAQPPGDKPLLFLRNNAHIVYIYTYIYLTYIYICIL